MKLCCLAALGLLLPLCASSPAVSAQCVDFPFDRIPKASWARELVWLRNIGIDSIEAPGASPEFRAVAAQAGIKLAAPSAARKRVLALDPSAILASRAAILDNAGVLWTGVESETSPVFRAGAVGLNGDETPSLQNIRREAAVWSYWSPVLSSVANLVSVNKIPNGIAVKQKAIPEASALSVINSTAVTWQGDLHVVLPSFHRSILVPGVSVPAHDALLLPVDVSFADKRFCRFCSGMSNSERLLYATAELTAIEYENGILSFEFYAPVAASAVLQLERQPNGPMLAGGHPAPYDWDAENKRAKLPIPAGKGPGKRVRIAITMTAPDEVASFVNAKALMIGQKNEILTDYSSEALAKRSRLIAPEAWKCTAVVKSPTQIAYTLEVPANRLHGEREDLRLEADGIGMSHVRVSLLRPLSIHVAEAVSSHFGPTAELVSDPPLIPVEVPTGRNITVQLRNNSPEIRTFHVTMTGQGLEFTPARVEVSIGASSEREASFRVFATGEQAGLREGTVHVSGATAQDKLVQFVMIPRGETVTYSVGNTWVTENSRIRAVFSTPEGGRWIEFYWKPTGKSLLPPEGVALNSPVKIELHANELTIEGATGLPRGGKAGTLDWGARAIGTATTYALSDTTER